MSAKHIDMWSFVMVLCVLLLVCALVPSVYMGYTIYDQRRTEKMETKARRNTIAEHNIRLRAFADSLQTVLTAVQKEKARASVPRTVRVVEQKIVHDTLWLPSPVVPTAVRAPSAVMVRIVANDLTRMSIEGPPYTSVVPSPTRTFGIGLAGGKDQLYAGVLVQGTNHTLLTLGYRVNRFPTANSWFDGLHVGAYYLLF